MKFRCDLAAQLFSYLQTRSRSNVFQLCAEIRGPVDVQQLNRAITRTAPYFPAIMVQRKVTIWNDWLESSQILPQAVYWSDLPRYFCDMNLLSQCAVQILYDSTHIAVVFCHYITDGNGGRAFFEHLLREYFQCPQEQQAALPLFASTEDAYQNYKSDEKKGVFSIGGRAFQISADEHDKEVRTTDILCSVNQIKQAARRHQATVNQFLTAVLILAIARVRKKRGRPIRLMIPLNLRTILHKNTQRNFTLYITAEEPEQDDLRMEELIWQIREKQIRQMDQQMLESRINENLQMEQHFLWRKLPFALRSALIKLVHRKWLERQFTMTFSNLGLFSSEIGVSHIKKVSFMLTPLRCGLYNCSCISCNGQLVLSFVRCIRQPVIENAFLQVLSELGIEAAHKGEYFG